VSFIEWAHNRLNPPLQFKTFAPLGFDRAESREIASRGCHQPR
jgi:hypothetical protein